MASPPKSVNSQDSTEISPTNQHTSVSHRVGNFFSVGTKINCGYALALSIAVIGTATGLILGSYSYEQARHRMDVADDESGIVSGLQGALLELQVHRRELRFQLDQSQDIKPSTDALLGHIQETKAFLAELREFVQTNNDVELNALLQQYGGAINTYINTLESNIKQLDQLSLKPTERQRMQQFISEATLLPETLQFYEFIHKLTEDAKTVRQEQAAADEAQSQATVLQAQIITMSVGLSIAIAAILAFLTSRAISRPIEELTRVSRQITQESNFNLQAPVTTHDEIGLLAVSFNQLVQRVKQLLEEQEAALERERQMQEAKLIQSEKMSSLGQMLAGVAHEINNPVNFIYGNLSHANDYISDMLRLLQTYEAEIVNPPPAIQTQIEGIDLEFLIEDLPKVLNSMKLGAERVRQIVLSLKNFSRLDDTEPHPVNLQECLDSTLLILDNRIKKGIRVIRNYSELPEIEGFAGLLYQVFMNLLSNAIDALQEKSSEQIREIEISTSRTGSNQVIVRIADNGIGIPAEVQSKIFEMFFTTKPSGVGTGMGLAISRQIIVEKHQGTLDCHSQVGKGTEFTITLPIKHSCREETPILQNLLKPA